MKRKCIPKHAGIRAGFTGLIPNPYGQPNNPDVPNSTFISGLLIQHQNYQ